MTQQTPNEAAALRALHSFGKALYEALGAYGRAFDAVRPDRGEPCSRADSTSSHACTETLALTRARFNGGYLNSRGVRFPLLGLCSCKAEPPPEQRTIRMLPVRPPEGYGKATVLVQFLALAFLSDGGRISVADRERLERIYAAPWPRVDGRNNKEAIRIAKRIIDEAAPEHQRNESKKHQKDPLFVDFFVWRLANEVHWDFSKLIHGHTDAVDTLLRRWIPPANRGRPGRAARNTSANELTKLTSDGILKALDALAGAPLSWTAKPPKTARKPRRKPVKK
jgi:hypothetical protein